MTRDGEQDRLDRPVCGTTWRRGARMPSDRPPSAWPRRCLLPAARCAAPGLGLHRTKGTLCGDKAGLTRLWGATTGVMSSSSGLDHGKGGLDTGDFHKYTKRDGPRMPGRAHSVLWPSPVPVGLPLTTDLGATPTCHLLRSMGKALTPSE